MPTFSDLLNRLVLVDRTIHAVNSGLSEIGIPVSLSEAWNAEIHDRAMRTVAPGFDPAKPCKAQGIPAHFIAEGHARERDAIMRVMQGARLALYQHRLRNPKRVPRAIAFTVLVDHGARDHGVMVIANPPGAAGDPCNVSAIVIVKSGELPRQSLTPAEADDPNLRLFAEAVNSWDATSPI